MQGTEACLQPISADLEIVRRKHTCAQVLVASLPAGLSSVDCNGNETSILQCLSAAPTRELCGIPNSNLTQATVLACASSAEGILFSCILVA